jgi:hypothetical protein
VVRLNKLENKIRRRKTALYLARGYLMLKYSVNQVMMTSTLPLGNLVQYMTNWRWINMCWCLSPHSNQHILPSYLVVSQLWGFIDINFVIVWLKPCSVASLLATCQGNPDSKQRSDVTDTVESPYMNSVSHEQSDRWRWDETHSWYTDVYWPLKITSTKHN